MFELNLFLDGFLEFVFGLHCPWSPPLKKLVHGDSQGPDVALSRVIPVFEGLGTHIQRTADFIAVPHRSFTLDCKSQVGQFGAILVDQDVVGFNIAMDYTPLVEMAESSHYLDDEFESFIDSEPSCFRQRVPLRSSSVFKSPSAQY